MQWTHLGVKSQQGKAFALLQISGTVAARSMELVGCPTAQSLGKAAVIQLCQPLTLSFGYDKSTRCGNRIAGWKLVSGIRWFYDTSLRKFSMENCDLEFPRTTAPLQKRGMDICGSEFLRGTLVDSCTFYDGVSYCRLTPPRSNGKGALANGYSPSQLAGAMEKHGISDVGTVIQTVQHTAFIPELFPSYRLLNWAPAAALRLVVLTVMTCSTWRLRFLRYRFGHRMRSRVMPPQTPQVNTGVEMKCAPMASKPYVPHKLGTCVPKIIPGHGGTTTSSRRAPRNRIDTRMSDGHRFRVLQRLVRE